jgi:uncharacterized protein (DUF2267 family)
MSATGLEVFDKTIQTANAWLDDIMAELGPDRPVAWHVLGAVLRSLRDRLPLELGVHLGAQLPLIVRGTYYEQWHAPGIIERSRTREEFLKEIRERLSHTRPVNVEAACRAVFGLLSRRIDPGQTEKIRHALPRPIRELWPGPA